MHRKLGPWLIVALLLSGGACAPERGAGTPVGVSTVTASAPDAASPPAPKAPRSACPPRAPSLLFPVGSDIVTPAQDEELEQLASCVAKGELGDATVIAVGHADAGESKGDGLALALSRAERVREFLIAHGVPADRVTATSAGNQSSLATSAGRRVDLYFFAPSAPAATP